MLFKTISIKDIIVYKLIMMSFLFIVRSSFGIEQYTAHGGPVKGLAVSTNIQLMASASFDYSVVIWDLNPIKEKLTLIGHDAAVNTVKFSPNNDFLASGGDDNNILLWAIKDINNLNEEIQPIKLGNHRGKIADLEFSNNGRYLISASWDGTVGVWDLKKRKLINSLVGHKVNIFTTTWHLPLC